MVQMNYLKERGLVTVKTENAGKSKEIPSSFQEGSCTFPSMKFPLQGVEEYSYLPDYLGPVETTMTTLPCGLRIGSENSSVWKNWQFPSISRYFLRISLICFCIDSYTWEGFL